MYDINDYDFGVFDPSKKYHLHCDFDTIIFSCAAAVSKEPCVVKHNRSGRKKTFDNFDAFIDFLENDEKGKNFTVKDFDVPVIGFALSNTNNKLRELINHNWISDFTLYVGGKGNFRKDIYPDYKANRGKSPAMRKFVYDYVLWKYTDNVVVSSGKEAEDDCIANALKQPTQSIIGFCDKDLTTQSGLFINYLKLDKGVFFISKEQAFYNLCVQILMGDMTDNILGIKAITPALKEKYNVKTKSVGKATAMKLLEDVKQDKILMKERVVDVYKLSYGDAWKDKLDFTGKLVMITKSEGNIFDVGKFMKGVGV